MPDKRYSWGAHTQAVTRNSGVRLAADIVLRHLCERSEYDRPEVTITKNQIIQSTGLERKAVQRGLAKLREKGIAVPIRGFSGGKCVPVTYRLVNIKADDDATPAPATAQGDPDKVRKTAEWNAAFSRHFNETANFGKAQKLADAELGLS